MRSEPQLGGQRHPEGRSGAEDGGAVDAPGPLARVDGGAPVVTIPARQARAFRVIDNRTSELTSWDTDLLPDALAGLNDLDIFSFDDVLPLAATAGQTDPDDIPETPKNPVSRVGDIWTLGKHRLMCGDATKPDFTLVPKASAATAVWWIGVEQGNDHPAPFPVAFAERCIQSVKSGPVLDSFVGSGTTIIAAERLKRACYAMEIAPSYCDVIVKRWEDFTGRKAKRLVKRHEG